MPEQINASVLLVEDHQNLAETIGDYLENSGFVMDYAGDGLTGLHLATTHRYDVIILDIMLPGIDGYQLAHRLRKDAQIGTPIIMLTARDQLPDKLKGFAEGADDYLVKPFDMPELEARLLAIIRRQRGELDAQILSIADLTFDPRTLEVERSGKKIKLSPTAIRILHILMRESPKIVSREELEHELWGELIPDSDTLRSHLYNLRKAIDRPFDKPLIHTLQGMGFKISA